MGKWKILKKISDILKNWKKKNRNNFTENGKKWSDFIKFRDNFWVNSIKVVQKRCIKSAVCFFRPILAKFCTFGIEEFLQKRKKKLRVKFSEKSARSGLPLFLKIENLHKIWIKRISKRAIRTSPFNIFPRVEMIVYLLLRLFVNNCRATLEKQPKFRSYRTIFLTNLELKILNFVFKWEKNTFSKFLQNCFKILQFLVQFSDVSPKLFPNF